MNNQELTDYIFENKYSAVSEEFISWLNNSTLFKSFTIDFKDKIRKRVRTAIDMFDIQDVIAELKTAFLILRNNNYKLIYEPYGSQASGPDFLVGYNQNEQFYLEVKHIRETEPGLLLDEFIKKIKHKIENHPSNLAISLHFHNFSIPNATVSELVRRESDVVSDLIQIINEHENVLPYDSVVFISLPIFKENIKVRLTKPSKKQRKNKTSFHLSSRPIFYSEKQYFKFTDIICESLSQLRSENPNFILIISDNTTHEPDDLLRACQRIEEFVDKRYEEFFVRKGFKDFQNFIYHLKKLNGVIFRGRSNYNSKYRNQLWINKISEHRVNTEILDILENLNDH